MLLLLLLLIYALTDGFTWGVLLFLLIAAVALAWFISAVGTSVQLTDDALTVARPLRTLIAPGQPATQSVTYRQLIGVEESGRFLATITLLYYPLGAGGLLDLDRIASLTLPIVVDQTTLRDRLEAVVPQ